MIDLARALLLGFALLQAILMFVDEGIFHRRRGLGRFERWGHVADTLMFFIALCVPAFTAPSQGNLIAFIILAIASCLLITKDEWIHSKECIGAEQWCHSMLFILHGALLAIIGIVWINQPDSVELKLLPIGVLVWALYQTLYWNLYYDRSRN